MDMTHSFIPLALDAALSALAAFAGGGGVRSDDLIAGALALEILARDGKHSLACLIGLDAAMRGLRALATCPSLSGCERGRVAAVRFAAIVRETHKTLFH